MPSKNMSSGNTSSKVPLTLRATGLGRRYGRHWALARVDLEVAAGEVVLLAGANGSGKTTLLRLVAGLIRPTKGSVSICGLDPQRQPLRCRRMLSMISHQAYLYPRLSALQTARIWSQLLGLQTTDATLIPLLEEVGLGGRQNEWVAGFSAGMKKRLAFVRTRLEKPRLVLLDEPFSALDAAGRKMVESWIDAFRQAGTSVLLASHTLARAARLADRGVLLEHGQVAWRGPAEAVAARLEAASG